MSGVRRRSEISAAIIYLSAALVMVLYLRLYFPGSWPPGRYEIAALFGEAMLLVSAIRAFMTYRFADAIALIGSLLVWPLVFRSVFYSYNFSPWLTFNLRGEGHDLHTAFLIATVAILATGSLFAATAESVTRVMPRTWHIGKRTLLDCTWPGLAVTILFIFIWYLHAVRPYQIPIFDLHQIRPIVSVLHVEKQGLRFHETSLAFYRGGEFYVTQSDRRLFQYSFTTSMARGVLTGDSLQLLNDLADSPPEIGGADVSSYAPPTTWYADRWFVSFARRSRGKPITKDVSVVPKEVLNLFREAQKLQPEWMQTQTSRDVCLGFCFDPTY